MMSYAYKVADEGPFWEVLKIMTGETPPDFVRGLWGPPEDDGLYYELQCWCAEYCQPEWSTGIGTIEAAAHLVEVAVGNGNIPPKE